MKITRFLATAICVALFLFGGLASAEPSGGRESLFLLGAGTRPLGMGGAFTAVTGDVSSTYWNPAALSLLGYRQVSWTHVSLYEQTDFDFAAAAWPILDIGTIAFGGMRIGTGDVEFRDEYGPLGSYEYSNGQYWLSYAHRAYKWVHVGGSMKLVDQSLAGFSSSTASIDAGILLQPVSVLTIGANFQDIAAGNMKLSRASESIPYNVKFGAALSWTNPERSFGFTVAADIDKTEGRSSSRHFGAEVMFMKYMYARAGYDRNFATVGAGIRYKLVSADYAYKSNDVLGASHRFGVTLFFGPTVSQQRENRIARAEQEESDRRMRERTTLIDSLWQTAFGAFSRNALDSASLLCSQILGYKPDHADASKLLGRIRELQQQQTETTIEEKSRRRAFDTMVADRVNNGMNLLGQGKLLEAREEFNQVLKLDSTNVDARAGIARIDSEIATKVGDLVAAGDARFAAEDYAEAVVNWNKALELNPNLPGIENKVARAKQLMVINQKLRGALETYSAGDTARARTLFNDVLKLDSNNQTAVEYLRTMDRVEAETVTLDELRQDEEYWKLYLDGLGYFRNADYDKAIEAWQKVLDKYPGSRETATNIEQAKLRKER